MLRRCAIVLFVALGLSQAAADTPKDKLLLLYSLNLAQASCALPVSPEQQAKIDGAIAASEQALHVTADQKQAFLAEVQQRMDAAISPNPKMACAEMNSFLGFVLKNLSQL